MKLACVVLVIVVTTRTFLAHANDVTLNSSEIVEKIVKEAWVELENSPSLYPHFFVYGLEIETSTGLSDVASMGGSLGVELHYERKTQ